MVLPTDWIADGDAASSHGAASSRLDQTATMADKVSKLPSTY